MSAGKVLLYRAGAVGDTLLSLFALRALRRRFPGARLLMAGYPERVRCLLDAGEVDEALDAEGEPLLRLHQGPRRGAGGEGGERLADFLRGLEAAAFFAADREGSFGEWVKEAGLARAVLSPPLPRPGEGVHVVEHMLGALRPLGVEAGEEGSPLLPSAAAREAAGELLRRCGHEEGGPPLLALHPGSGSPRKVFPSPLLALATQGAEEELGARLLLVTGPADDASRGGFLRGWRGRPPMEARGLPLPVLASLLARAHAFVGNDSGVAHLAALAGTPTLALFGPASRPALWGPRGRRVRVLAWEAAAGGGLRDALRALWGETAPGSPGEA